MRRLELLGIGRVQGTLHHTLQVVELTSAGRQRHFGLLGHIIEILPPNNCSGTHSTTQDPPKIKTRDKEEGRENPTIKQHVKHALHTLRREDVSFLPMNSRTTSESNAKNRRMSFNFTCTYHFPYRIRAIVDIAHLRRQLESIFAHEQPWLLQIRQELKKIIVLVDCVALNKLVDLSFRVLSVL